MTKTFSIFLVAALMLLAANTMFGQGACPVISGNGGGEGTDGTYAANAASVGYVNNGGCNILITFGPGGSINTTFPNAAMFYDTGADDNMVGILNNSGAPITSITLSSLTNAIFGFDGDGPCSGFTLTPPGGASGSTCAGVNAVSGDPASYLNATEAMAPGYTAYAGTIDFLGNGIANGGTDWFGLEAPVDINLNVNGSVPEPTSILLLGGVLLAVGRGLRRKLA